MTDESFVLVGTPFPQIKKTDAFGDPKRPNPNRDLEVRDEQGRRRFHGAFTGGYSAGYFNTVGSKEGWAPSEFVSSRDKRSERKMNRPEDYMDEEDKQMMKESSRLMTTEEFDTLGSSRKELEQKRAAARNMQSAGGALGVLPDKIIDDLILPSTEPVGIRLLKRMGWKPGQGIGPRVTKKRKIPQDMTDDEDDDTPDNITFAPIDSAIVIFTNKSNVYGLGFDPYKNAPEFNTRQQAQPGSKYLSGTDIGPKKGLGFGRFDDDDDDDDDVYGPGPASRLDFDSDLPESTSHGRHAQQGQGKAKSMARGTSPLYCSDGRPPLPGFVLASAASTKSLKWYSAPKVPADFVPHHVFPEDIKPVAPPSSRQQQLKLTADDRAMVLGETPIDVPRRSVFEYMSAENKNRLDSILGMVLDTEGDKTLKKDYFEVPKIEKSSAEAALKGFMPFGDNLAKQSRYKQYLNIQAGQSDETITLVEGFSGADMTKELNEFVQAARIFKPLSSTMSSRFTTASKVIEFAQPAAGLRSAAEIKASAADKSSPMHAVVERMEVPKSQAAKAAAMGMFGPLTRTTVDFYPAKLLCKRFNVPNPHPDHKDTGPEAAKDLLDKSTMDNMMMNRRPGEGMAGDDQKSSVSTLTPDETDVIEPVEPQPEAQETLDEEVLERPPMDIFKAIFDDSDSEDDDSDSESTTEQAKEDAPIQGVAPESAPVKGQEPEGPFRPVFTRRSERGLDTGSTSRGGVSLKKIDISNQGEDEDENENEFGPKLSISKPTSDRKNKSESMSVSKPKGPRSSRKRDIDSESEMETREISKGTRAISLLEETGLYTRQSTEEAFKDLTVVEKEDDEDRSASVKTSRRSPSPDSSSSARPGSREESSKKHKSSHPSSSSKSESSRHRSSHSSSRNRSSSRSRRHDSDSKDSRSRDGDKDRSRHSESSRTPIKEQEPKRSSRDKDKDRERDHDSRRRHGKSSKSSRSDRDGDKISSSSSASRREKTKDAYFDVDDDDMWVEKSNDTHVGEGNDDKWIEKRVDTPVIPARATISHRPRASEYF
ncbi:MAG: hypothetical protein BYD32DRAFT_417971 [Podila humilis]|nr:MAG: hypothetical protein BYD32DRAFT_417971 [Podila humilis]